jgi:hypothetical protein
MIVTLQDYIFVVRRLLHDANANFWTDEELTIDINDARQRLVRDTGCHRILQTSAVLSGIEAYDFSTLPQGTKTMDVINLNVYWGNSRVPLRYVSWTQFNAQMRYWINYQGQPVIYSMYGPNKYFVAPVPDQDYVTELDTVVRPTDLVALDDIDTDIVDPWKGPVPFYAAYMAKFKEQSYGEAELFKQQYTQQVQNVLSTTFTRRMPDPYSHPY